MDEKYQIFRTAQYPVYTFESRPFRDNNKIVNIHTYSSESAVYNGLFNSDWFRKDCNGEIKYSLDEYNDNFKSDYTYMPCGDDKPQFYQILVKKDKLHDNNSYSNDGTVYIDYYNLKHVYNPTYHMFTGNCGNQDYLAANKIHTNGTLISGYLSKNLPIPSSIGYDTKYNCSYIPLGEYPDIDYETFTSSVKLLSVYNLNGKSSVKILSDYDLNGKYPLKNISAGNTEITGTFYKIHSTYTVFDENNNKKINYVITSSNYDGNIITLDKTDKYYIYNDINSTFSNIIIPTDLKQYIGSDNYFNTSDGEHILFQNMNYDFKQQQYQLTNSNPVQITCNNNDYLTGFKKVYNPENETVTIIPHCVHYDIKSTVLDLSNVCPEDGDWPETKILTRVEMDCPANETGNITRYCGSDGKWLTVVSNCSKITCLKDGNWPETEVGKTETRECSNGSGIITRRCVNDNGIGKWEKEESTCKTDTTLISIVSIISICFVIVIIIIAIIKFRKQRHEEELAFINSLNSSK